MKTKGIALLVAAVAALAVIGGAGAKQQTLKATTITGAGSTFVAPLVSTWTPALGSAFDYTLQYSAVGSGAGVSAITARTVDFGASDAPLTSDQFTACNGCVQIPWALAGTAIDYNIPGLVVPKNTNLRLSGDVIAKIYMGQITTWDDPAIKALNPKATIPSLSITVAHRSDNSGTTYNFTDYLTSVSSAWSTQYGRGVAVAWPVGIGASGSSGVAGVVKNTPGAIGYTDTGYAIANHLHFASVENAAGNFVNPSIRNVAVSGNTITSVPAGNELHIVNPPKKYTTAYPIATYTYIILPTKTGNATALRKMVFWALTQGQLPKYTAKLWFVPIPKVVLVAAEKTLKLVQAST